MSQHLAKQIIKVASPVAKEVGKAAVGLTLAVTAVVIAKNKDDRKDWIDEKKRWFGF